VSYTISPAQVGDEGVYSVIVTNIAGTAASLGAELRVNSQPFLANAHVRGDGFFEFTIVAQTNRIYAVEYSANFNGWTNLTNVNLSAPQTLVVDPGSTNTAMRFYRVRVP
jgi:hypothetical protein